MTAEVIIEGSKASLKGKGPVCGEELVLTAEDYHRQWRIDGWG